MDSEVLNSTEFVLVTMNVLTGGDHVTVYRLISYLLYIKSE